MSKTIGELKVRTTFNPSNDSIIDQIKQKSAELINLIDSLNMSNTPGELPEYSEGGDELVQEFNYCKYESIKDIETGCMFAVKAATIKL